MTEQPVRCLTVDQVAEVLAVSSSTVYRLVREGHLPSIRVGKAGRRITSAQLDQFIASGGAAA